MLIVIDTMTKQTFYLDSTNSNLDDDSDLRNIVIKYVDIVFLISFYIPCLFTNCMYCNTMGFQCMLRQQVKKGGEIVDHKSFGKQSRLVNT